MNVSIFKISYNVVTYDRAANAPERKPYTAEQLRNAPAHDRHNADDPRNRTEFRPGFSDRSHLGHTGPVDIVVAAENQISAVAFIQKPSDPNQEINVLSIQELVHGVPMAGTVAGTAAPKNVYLDAGHPER